MARNNVWIEPTFWAYYDKATGNILAVTNVDDKKQKNRIEITPELHSRLVAGKEKFSDYTVGYLRSDDGKNILSITAKKDLAFIFKNTMLTVVSLPPADDTDVIVEWNKEQESWFFSLSEDAKKTIALKFGDIRIVFFVTLENDFDFLVRTIVLNNEDLMAKEKIQIPFEHDIETQINKITISTKIVYQSYGLLVND
jgi:hypothetical protein